VAAMPTELFQNLIWKDILSVKNNRLMVLNEVSISSYGSKAWAYTLQEVANCMTPSYLQEVGYLMGQDAAKEINEILKKKQGYVPPDLADIANIIRLGGFGVVSSKEQDSGFELVVLQNHIIAAGKEMYGNDSRMEYFYSGIYRAFFEVLKDKPFSIKHENCTVDGKEQIIFRLGQNV
jgi:predicted hydrocarbon binding protein